MAKQSPKEALETLGKDLVAQIKKDENPTLQLPVRSLSNVKFDEKTKKLGIGQKMTERQFFNVSHAKKFLQTIDVAGAIKELIDVDKTSTLRDVFYRVKRTIPGTKTETVDQQTESDKAIEDLELITGFSREKLHVNANKMGSVAGNVTVVDAGDTINWAKMGSGGWSIPSNVENVEFKKVDAKYIIYMEKAAVWERLNEDKFWKKQNCIIVSSQGQSTRGIRRLLQRLSSEHKLPIYVLTDNDPWGIYIYSVLKYGSISLAHMSEGLAISNVKYLGVTCDDVEKYQLQRHYIALNDKDIARIKQMADYEWFKDNKAWQRQFKMMKKAKAKVEIQALSARGITFISDTYLPEKIKNKDFLE
ncbi:MAG: DNA topoisomerase IV subunit A [Candidatus Woesearchaeota archaeon]|nr:DNA topoisomerase IV subunit A [Candidatus Woesearchaeota archaeon]